MVLNVWYLNGPPSHVNLLFEYLTPVLSCIQVFSIQIVTVFLNKTRTGLERQNESAKRASYQIAKIFQCLIPGVP